MVSSWKHTTLPRFLVTLCHGRLVTRCHGYWSDAALSLFTDGYWCRVAMVTDAALSLFTDAALPCTDATLPWLLIPRYHGYWLIERVLRLRLLSEAVSVLGWSGSETRDNVILFSDLDRSHMTRSRCRLASRLKWIRSVPWGRICKTKGIKC